MIGSKKKQLKYKRGIYMMALLIAMLTFTGCSSKTKDTTESETKTTVKEPTKENIKEEVIPEQQVNTVKDEVQTTTTKEDEAQQEDSQFKQYCKLIGLSKEELITTLSEEPVGTDEGGLEFTKAGIRVWMDPSTNETVDQIFTTNASIDFNGAKIGDKLSKFKEVFQEPISDTNGDAHFSYENVFISVNYDAQTQDTYAVYILKNNF